MAYTRTPRQTNSLQSQNQAQTQPSQPSRPSQPPAFASPQPSSQSLHQSSNHAAHKRHMQQFYLHKSFDLSSDAEFLPLIPSDPVAAAFQSRNMYIRPDLRDRDQPYYKNRRHSGSFLHQHLFGGKRSDYAQYKQN